MFADDLSATLVPALDCFIHPILFASWRLISQSGRSALRRCVIQHLIIAGLHRSARLPAYRTPSVAREAGATENLQRGLSSQHGTAVTRLNGL